MNKEELKKRYNSLLAAFERLTVELVKKDPITFYKDITFVALDQRLDELEIKLKKTL